MKCSLIVSFILILSLSSCAQSKSANAELYLVTFASKDIGDVRFYLELEMAGGQISGGSLQNAYADNFGFADRTKINWFAGIKNKRLVSVKGYYRDSNNVIRFRTAFYSPISNYYLNGRITNGQLEGEFFSPDSSSRGKLYGALYKKGKPAPLLDYRRLSDSFGRSFEANFFDPAFFKSSKYKTFKGKLLDYSSNSIDDLHYAFSAFYYARELPYSHIGLWRRAGVEKEDTGTDKLEYIKKGTTGILTIPSFTTEEGAIKDKFTQIFSDNPENLIIDLRNNPGGNIGPAIELGQYLVQGPTSGGFFLSRAYYASGKGDMSACHVFSSGTFDQFMEEISKNSCIEVKIFPNQRTFKKPVYILIDNATASTCEPIVYALKQEPNITIIGQKTAGKMLSAKEVPLMDGFVLFVPNADYVTTAKERLDQKGVEPEVSLKEETDALTYALSLTNKK